MELSELQRQIVVKNLTLDDALHIHKKLALYQETVSYWSRARTKAIQLALDAGATQEEVAQKLGISRGRVAQIVRSNG